jgi:hypothetical protein
VASVRRRHPEERHEAPMAEKKARSEAAVEMIVFRGGPPLGLTYPDNPNDKSSFPGDNSS